MHVFPLHFQILFKDVDQNSTERPGDKEDEKLDKLDDGENYFVSSDGVIHHNFQFNLN